MGFRGPRLRDMYEVIEDVSRTVEHEGERIRVRELVTQGPRRLRFTAEITIEGLDAPSHRATLDASSKEELVQLVQDGIAAFIAAIRLRRCATR